MADWLKKIEQHRARRERDQILYGGYNPQRDKDEEALIAEVKRLRRQLEVEHDQGESFLMQIKDVRAEIEIERLKHGGL